jgi:hypothetical protein
MLSPPGLWIPPGPGGGTASGSRATLTQTGSSGSAVSREALLRLGVCRSATLDLTVFSRRPSVRRASVSEIPAAVDARSCSRTLRVNLFSATLSHRPLEVRSLTRRGGPPDDTPRVVEGFVLPPSGPRIGNRRVGRSTNPRSDSSCGLGATHTCPRIR